MASDVMIHMEGVWKRYGLGINRVLRQASRVLRTGDGSELMADDGPWALRDINLTVHQGETFGIIGRNGAGKSTLLKVLAGVAPPTQGKVEVRGRVFPMIELNAGLHRELTGRENVRLLGAIMGLSWRDIETKMSEIEEFTELGEWFDRPVRTYSSGMLARLGFGVAMNVEAEVLLVDEVLAVGDLAFQGKCYQRLEAMRTLGVTILFVSHSLRHIDRLCDRVAFLDSGQCQLIGPSDQVVQAYYNFNQEAVAASLGPRNSRLGVEDRGDVAITDVEFLNEAGESVQVVEMFKPLIIRLRYLARRRIENPITVIGILSPEMLQVTNFNTANLAHRPAIEGVGYVDCVIPEIHLMPGNYGIKCIIMTALGLKHYRAEGIAWFKVSSDTYTHLRGGGGFVYTPVRWHFAKVDT